MNTNKSIEIVRPFSRNNNLPIDISSVWESYEEALAYAQTSGISYPGQVISIINSKLKEVYLYQVAYDKKSNNYTLVNRNVSAKDASTAFRLLGTVDRYSDLPQTGEYGDMYYCTADARFYIATENKDGTLNWIYLRLNVDVVTAYTDGLLSSKTYAAMINNTNGAAIWYSEDNNPENNHWLPVDNIGTTDTNSLVTTTAVKNIVADLLQNYRPSMEVTDANGLSYCVGKQVNPVLTITYRRNNGGFFNNIKIYRSTDSGKNWVDTLINYTGNNNTDYIKQSWIVTDKTTNVSTITFTDFIGFKVSKPQEVLYKFVIKYNESDDGLVAAGTLEYILTYNVYPAVYIGTNDAKSEVALPLIKEGTDFTFTFDADDKFTNMIYIEIPKGRNIESVTYKDFNDEECLSLFTGPVKTDKNRNYPVETDRDGDTYRHYEYPLDELNIDELGVILYNEFGLNVNSAEIQNMIKAQKQHFTGKNTYVFRVK